MTTSSKMAIAKNSSVAMTENSNMAIAKYSSMAMTKNSHMALAKNSVEPTGTIHWKKRSD